MKDINIMFSELAQYTRIMEEAAATVDSLKDEIKAYMNEHNTDILTGNEHRATYKAIQRSRIDTAALKKKKRNQKINIIKLRIRVKIHGLLVFAQKICYF